MSSSRSKNRTYHYDAADNTFHVYEGGIPVRDDEDDPEPTFEELIQREISQQYQRDGRGEEFP